MQSSLISQEAALRVAIASRLLPNIELSSLLGLLIQHLGEPLSEAKLVGLSPKAFRVMVGSLGDGPTRKEVTSALAVLTNPEASDVGAPEVKSAPPLTGPKLRVAITSNQGEMINGHYGSCMRVLIYEVNHETHQLIDVREIKSDLKGEGRAIYMVDLIRDCQILFTLSIGGPAAARVTRADVHPIKKTTPVSADVALSELSDVIKYKAPPWLRKVMGLEPEHHIVPEMEY
ncbi:NifB/NifX family molybdenum-iron cluster-binding protein [Vibrio salinus]|uniref:NifB/NifX family molybdenum-iron cluster-binding protein n=1 Tax=Vibrio salinus TaxID=2899784 RepID=UPI001E4A024D|nr:NifB/NifX family molybdenum-iron cluster-binding protein [Vibrio salinus]MCE0495410.1 dinitrogenase iron-molybdenum cofactor [Vibrio salinus]